MSTDNAGTLMGKMNSNTHGDGWVTSGHVVDGYNSVYETVGPNSIRYLGSIEEVIDDGNIDCAFITEGQDSASQISDENNSEKELDVVGYIPDSAIENYVGDPSIEVSAQGYSSGRLSGTIESVRGSPTEALVIDPYMDSGDSGGPIFETNAQDEAWFYGSIKGAWPINNTRGTTIETIVDELNLNMP